jgi:two-component system, NarL family, invasion response regulator UvrY
MDRRLPRSPSRRRPVVGVVTVDDQALFRQVVREVVEATPGFELLGEAAGGEAALDLADEVEPDLVLVDVRMPGIDGLETARRLRAAHPTSIVVLVSSEDSAAMPADVCSCGAAAFLSKEDFGQPALRWLWAAHGRP